MMKHSKRFLCLLLTLILAASLCVFPAAAADQTCPSSKDDPVVFVHGLMGWGQRAGINAVLPYWGMTTGSLTSYLNALGYETYSATVGPISSAWDRACELYAQLTGTTVDYGAAHAAAHAHARYGITYDQPLFAGWGTKRAVNLVGHSFGGATTRQFLELMANGSAEEVAAAKAAGTAPSPLFTGGKRSWVHSMTEIAAPHNGTTFIESNGAIMDAATNLAETLAKGFGITEIKNLYDFQLEQFGIYKDPNETVLETLQRVFSTDFMSHNDNAFLDLTIDRSLEINDGIGIEPNVYYFSYAGNQTVQDPVSGNYIPSARMWTLFYPGAINMGKYYDKYTAGGFYIDQSWRPNDGMVNTVSAFYPIHSDGTCLTRDGRQGWTNYDGYSNIHFKPGIWYVMPVQSFDHIQFVGGMLNGSLVKTHALYRGVMEDIYNTYTTAPSGGSFPFTDVAESRWSYPYIREMYEAGVIDGMTPTTFEPAGNVTRAQFVKMLALLQSADVSAYASGPFTDVPGDAWYARDDNWAAANAIVNGTSETTFDPNAAISRQDMAVMLYRYAQQYGIALPEQTAAPFTDEGSVAAYALPAVQALHRAGVINGMPDGSFRPYDTATREQACAVLCALCAPERKRLPASAGGRFLHLCTAVRAVVRQMRPCVQKPHMQRNLIQNLLRSPDCKPVRLEL